MPDFEAGASVRLCASLDSLTVAMRAQQEARASASDVWYVHAPAMSFPAAALPAAGQAWGPNTGFAWAVQRLSVSGFGNSTDFVNAYRGLSPFDAQPQNALWSFSVPAQGDVSTWHPGRTGLVLMPDEGLVFGGTFTGANVIVSADVIQMTLRHLPQFLL